MSSAEENGAAILEMINCTGINRNCDWKDIRKLCCIYPDLFRWCRIPTEANHGTAKPNQGYGHHGH